MARMVLERRGSQIKAHRNTSKAFEGLKMIVIFKIRRELLGTVQRDLSRPHRFAWERVGFLSGPVGPLEREGVVILAHAYHPIDDDDYIESDEAAAMMGSVAIRKALQFAHSNQTSMFHVHRHDHLGRPSFSNLDLRENAKFMPDFSNVCPEFPHGALVLSMNSFAGICWHPDILTPISITEVIVVGAPMEVISHGTFR